MSKPACAGGNLIMAIVAKSGTPSMCSPEPCDGHKYGDDILVGEDVAAGDACYIKSDGKVWKSTAVAAAAAAEVHGWAAHAAKVAQRQVVTLYFDVNFKYGSGLTPGAYLYLSAVTAGAIDTASSANQLKPVAVVIDATRIRVTRTF
jgi:hypothetical protein